MKLILLPVFVIGLVAILSAPASAKPFILTDILLGINDGIQGVANGVGNFAQSAITAAGNIANGMVQVTGDAVSGAIKVGTGIGAGIAKGAQGFTIQVLDLFREVTKTIDKTITEQLQEFGSKVLQRAVTEVRSELQKIQSEVDTLVASAKAKLTEAQDKSNDYIEKKEVEWNKWGDAQLKSVENSTEDAQQEAQDLVDSYIDASKNELQVCTDSIISNIQKLVDQSSDTVQSFYPPINDLLNQIDTCSRVSISDFQANTNCARDVRKKLTPLKSAPGQILKLSASIARNSVGSVQSLGCVPKTVAKLDKDKKNIEKQIKELAKQKDSTTAAAESTTLASDESSTAVSTQASEDSSSALVTTSAPESTASSSTTEK